MSFGCSVLGGIEVDDDVVVVFVDFDDVGDGFFLVK